MQYELGDIVITKKAHPCGSVKWEIVRTGADYKLKCLGCNHIVLISSEKFKKAVKAKDDNKS